MNLNCDGAVFLPAATTKPSVAVKTNHRRIVFHSPTDTARILQAITTAFGINVRGDSSTGPWAVFRCNLVMGGYGPEHVAVRVTVTQPLSGSDETARREFAVDASAWQQVAGDDAGTGSVSLPTWALLDAVLRLVRRSCSSRCDDDTPTTTLSRFAEHSSPSPSALVPRSESSESEARTTGPTAAPPPLPPSESVPATAATAMSVSPPSIESRVLCGICVAAAGDDLAALLEQSESADMFVKLHAERSPFRVVVCDGAIVANTTGVNAWDGGPRGRDGGGRVDVGCVRHQWLWWV